MLLDRERVIAWYWPRPGGGAEEATMSPTCVLPPTVSPRWGTVNDEPINSRIDMPGYWLDDIDKALRLIETIGRSNVGAPTRPLPRADHPGDLARSIEENIAQIGHVQIADNRAP